MVAKNRQAGVALSNTELDQYRELLLLSFRAQTIL